MARARPDLRANRLVRNGAHGLLIAAHGGGRISANTLEARALGVEVRAYASAHLKGNTVAESSGAGVVVSGSKAESGDGVVLVFVLFVFVLVSFSLIWLLNRKTMIFEYGLI